MPRKRRADQGPPVPRIRNACARCKAKRFKCSDERPCANCVSACEDCVPVDISKRQKLAATCSRRPDGAQCSAVAQAACGERAELLLEMVAKEAVGVIELARDDIDLTTALATCPSEARGQDENADSFTIAIDSCGSTTNFWPLSPGPIVWSDPATLDSFLANPIFLSRPSTPTTSSLLESHPNYKELWYHYTEVLSCLHTSHEKTSNPIVRILAPVAQSSESLLAVLLASSLENYRSLRGLGPDEEGLGTLINISVAGVQKELSNPEQVSDSTLATVIALCDFEVVARKRATTSSWRVHLEGAKRIIALRGGPSNASPNTEFFRFLLKWLAYFDIMSSMTSTTRTTQPLFEGTYWLQPMDTTSHVEEDYKLDPYMSFLQDVVPYFLEIGQLTRLKSAKVGQLNLRDAHLLHLRCRTIENNLKHLLGSVTGQTWMSPKKFAVLIDCHDAFIYSTLIHLYRRVEGLSTTSPDVREAVKRGLDSILSSCEHDKTEIDSSLLFPLFTFGCEALLVSERDYVLERLRTLGALGLGNVDRAIDVLLSVWNTNSQLTPQQSIDWTEILQMFNWEVNLA